MGYRLVAVSGKFGGNRRLPTGKVNPGGGYNSLWQTASEQPTSGSPRGQEGTPNYYCFSIFSKY